MGMPGPGVFRRHAFQSADHLGSAGPRRSSATSNRCQFLLQQGQFVADVCYYYGDHVPNIVRRKQADPASVLPQYDYDVFNEEVLLTRMSVQGRPDSCCPTA